MSADKRSHVNPERATRARDRDRHNDRQRLAEIEAVCGKEKFQGRSRVEAAHYVRRLFQEVRQAGFRRDEIQDRIAEHAKSPGFRLDNWMLPRDYDVIDAAVVEEYQDKTAPQKKVPTYLAMIEVMAELLQRDAAALKIDMLKSTALWEQRKLERPEHSLEIEPAQRLGALMKACALSIAQRYDLAGLFEQARRLNAGWDLDAGPKALLRSEAFDEAFDPRKPAVSQLPIPTELPPYPTVAIGRIPFGVCETSLFVEDPIDGEDDSEELDPDTGIPLFPHVRAEARLTAYWDLYLSIAPVNAFGDIGMVFMENPRVDVEILSPDNLSGRYETTVSDFHQFNIDTTWMPRTLCGRKMVATSSTDLTQSAKYTRPGTPEDPIKRAMPHEESSDLVRFHAVDPRHISAWISEEKEGHVSRIQRVILGDIVDCETGEIVDKEPRLIEWWNDTDNRDEEHQGHHIWFENRGVFTIAGDLEVAMTSGRLEHRFIRWIEQFRRSLNKLEKDWIERAEAAEQELRDRWRQAERDSQINSPVQE